MSIKRVKTGIPGFDKLVNGGFPFGATILLSGTPGTAKSIFSMQYLYNGAVEHKERGLYVSFEQKKEDIFSQAKQFGWNLAELEKNNLLTVKSIPVKHIDHTTVHDMMSFIKENKIERVVVDSLSTLAIIAPIYSAIYDLFLQELVTQREIFSPSLSGDFILKRFIYQFIAELQELPITTILISEIGKESEYMSRDTVSEFLCDGVIQITFETMGGEYSRSLLVRKMRHVKNDEDLHPVEISKKGIVVHDLK